jgi:hypothetical protein
MFKDVLAETAVYSGGLKLPEGIEIDFETLRADILVHANDPSQQFRHSRSLDIISTYIRDFYRQKAKEPIRQKDAIGYIQNGYEGTDLIRQADLMDLKNAPDYTFLFGVNVNKDSCTVVIEFDNNRHKDERVTVPLYTNAFVMFPSCLRYQFKPNTSSQPNYILTQTYELK